MLMSPTILIYSSLAHDNLYLFKERRDYFPHVRKQDTLS